MPSDASIISVHSVAEAYLYLLATPCPDCRKGSLKQKNDLTKTGSGSSDWELESHCAACGAEQALRFEIKPIPTREQARSDRINPTRERSQAIDLLGWLTLFQTILAASGRESDKQSGRQLASEAAQCLDEALKFYEPDQELPGEDAFFTESARQRFETHPQHFARSKWLERRLHLPAPSAERVSKRPAPKHPWWRFWRRNP